MERGPYPQLERGQSISPTAKGQVHEAHHPTHPPSYQSKCKHCNLGRAKRGVESTIKTGVQIKGVEKCVPGTLLLPHWCCCAPCAVLLLSTVARHFESVVFLFGGGGFTLR